MKKILIIEDDEALLATLVAALEADYFEVKTAIDGKKGCELAVREKFDLICLDIKLPSLQGFDICRKLRDKEISTPIIFLTGEKKEEVDKVLGLELGGDDYIVKPFGTRELIARIRAVLRRSDPAPKDIKEISFGNVYIHFKKHFVRKNDDEVYLTSTELGLLKLLVSLEGEVVSRETILNQVWGYDKFPTTRTIDTFIHSLRHKLEDDPANPKHLLTIPWSGYKFVK